MSSGLYNTHKIDFDTTLDLTRLKPYGDTMNDGKVQTSFTLPVKDDERGEEAARQIAKKMGLEEPNVAYHAALDKEFTFYVVYGSCSFCCHLPFHDFNKGIEVFVVLHNHAGQALAAVLGTLHVGEDALLDGGEQAQLLDLLQQIGGLGQHLVGTVADDAVLFIGQLAAQVLHGAEDVLRILDGQGAVGHERGVDGLGHHAQQAQPLVGEDGHHVEQGILDVTAEMLPVMNFVGGMYFSGALGKISRAICAWASS